MPPMNMNIAPATRRTKNEQEPLEIGVALSVNGKLQSVFTKVPDDATRTQGYKAVKIGEPVLVRYLRFDITTAQLSNDMDKILISTYVKLEETKDAAAEVVTYFDPSPTVSGSTRRYVLASFAPSKLGHELIYYTPSFTGETVRVGTRIWELDSPNDALFRSLRSLVSGAAAIPAFADLLPISVSADQVVSIVEKLVKLLDKDDSLFQWDGIALYNDLDDSPRLQAGRYVVSLGINSTNLRDGTYTLSDENELLQNGKPVQDKSYIVFQVLNVQRDIYKSFNYALGAADMMRRINRPGSEESGAAAKDILLQAMTAWSDFRVVQQIQDLAPSAKSDADAKTRIQALQKTLTTASSTALSPWVDKITGA